MTKEEIESRLYTGEKFSDIFPYRTDGQDCTIFKAPWPEDDVSENRYEALYVPDIGLNDIDTLVDRPDLSTEEVHLLLSNVYTANDFLYQAYGNVKAAHELYSMTDWQTPSIDDLTDCTDSSRAKELWGETWEEMRSRDKNILDTRKELYRLYQLEWMASHGYSVKDILNECDNILYNFVQEGITLDDDPAPELDFENAGFDGSLWVCFNEFLDEEYQDDGYISSLYSYARDFCGEEKGKFLERWYQTDIGNYRDMYIAGYIDKDLELVPMLRES